MGAHCRKSKSKAAPDDFILMHNSIGKSAKYNFEGCKFPLDTDLNIDCFRFMLLDQSLCDLLEFGFPIGYMGKIQQQPCDTFSFVRNYKGAKEFAVHNKEIGFDAILGPFQENSF